MKRTSRLRLLGGIAVTLLMGVVWLLLAPPQLGGNTRYVSTHGISMVPVLHAGDLIAVRRQSTYRVGDIVAYHSTVLNTTVLHRIVGLATDGFVMKGDNNSFTDPTHPTPAQVLGSRWLVVGQGGTFIAWLRKPVHAIPLLSVMILFVFGGLAGRLSLRRRRARKTTRRARNPRGDGLAFGALQVLSISLAAGLVMALGAFMAYRQPASRPRTVSYLQTGRFSYGAQVTPGPAYQQATLTTGDPIFVRLVTALNLTFDYTFQSSAAHGAAGTATLNPVLSSSNGWRWSLPPTPAVAFTGDHATVGMQVLPAALLARTTQAEAASGVPGGTYTLTITPDVHLSAGLTTPGSAVGRGITQDFSPPLSFTLNPSQLSVTQPSALTATKTSSVQVPGTVRRHLVFQGLFIDVGLARRIATTGAAALLLVALVSAILVGRSRPDRRERGRIQARYHRWLIEVTNLDQRTRREVIEVASIESLVHLAERYERLVMVQHIGGREDVYAVEDDDICFRYRSAGLRRADGDAPAIVPPIGAHPPGEKEWTGPRHLLEEADPGHAGASSW